VTATGQKLSQKHVFEFVTVLVGKTAGSSSASLVYSSPRSIGGSVGSISITVSWYYYLVESLGVDVSIEEDNVGSGHKIGVRGSSSVL